MEDCVDQEGSDKFVTKLDMLRGYWQVPLTQRAQEISLSLHQTFIPTRS